jgi:uncharacterized integral membrane protein
VVSAFALFALVLLGLVTVFALSNPAPVVLRFLSWQVETTLALAVIGGAVTGGFLVFASGVLGQRQVRARLRELQARVRELEARAHGSSGSDPGPPA